jgi:DNA polymerase-3 subunit gamma/tau
MSSDSTSNASSAAQESGEYVVVARRYRPQSFEDLVGQGQVSQALSNAINTHRVGHAYLFTGARGVGKTSTARIFAKALNCVQGPTPTPCNRCDICQGVAQGGDVDVIEIDGASNRGIDEIRQLRSNVSVRPSRARFKIYIIDEVHMLTTAAFNALLKTLEEPPEHVKFIFCTTDPEKIPITVLSRCQRFDFPPVEADSIIGRLRHIVANEGLEADDEALRLLARRAAGSMRDSQSLLEQLLAFTSGRITVDDVHRMLGTAGGNRLAKLARYLIDRDAAGALAELESALHQSIDAGQLAEQLLGYFRDLMAVSVGCSSDLLLHASASDHQELRELAERFGLETTLAAVQVLDVAVTKMRHSVHARVLLEIALVRISRLENLEELAQLAARLQAGGPLPTATGARTQPMAVKAPPPPQNGGGDEKKKPRELEPSASVAGSQASLDHASLDHASLDHASDRGSPGLSVAVNPTDLSSSAPAAWSAASARRPDAGGQTPPAARPSPAGVSRGQPGEWVDLSSSDGKGMESAEAGSDSAPVNSAPVNSAPVNSAPVNSAPVNSAAANSVAANSEGAVETSVAARITLQPATARRVWEAALDLMEDMTADFGRFFAALSVPAGDRLVVTFRPEYTLQKQQCEKPERRQKFEQAVAQVVGRSVKVEFEMVAGESKAPERRAAPVSRVVRIREREKHPLVQQAKNMFEAEIVDVVEPRGEGG